MKANLKALLLLVSMALCLVASAQDLKPAKDKKTKKYGYRDKQKNWVIEPAFDDARKFDDDGCALVKVDGLYGLIDLEGKWVLPAEYDDIGKYNKHGLCEIRIKEGKTKLYGVADRSGKVVLPTLYSKVELPKNGSCILASAYVEEPGLEGSPVWGVYSPEGKEVFAPQFLYSPSVYDDKLIVKDARTSFYAIVDVSGNVLLPFEFLAIDHSYKGFETLDKSFVQAFYTEDVRRAETLAHPGAVLPYDLKSDRVRAAAWHVGCIARRLYANQVRSIEIQPGSVVSSALCTETGIDWGFTGRRFLRLEPVVVDTVDVFAMADPTSNNYYTLKALLFEQDGTLVGEVSSKGYLEAQCTEGTIYRTAEDKRWIILNDPNNLALPAFTMVLAGYRAINHDNVCNGLGISSNDLNRLTHVRTFANLNTDILEGENIGVTSYFPPVLDMRDARLRHDVMRPMVFHHSFMMGEVVNCRIRKAGDDVMELELDDNLVCRFEDKFKDPYYRMRGDDLIWWGPHNMRTVRITLMPTSNKNALADDIAGTGLFWDIVLEQYEEDGTWLRTLAVAPFADFAQDGVIVFEPLHIALLAPNAILNRQPHTNVIKLRNPKPLPHTVSALDAFRVHGHSGR